MDQNALKLAAAKAALDYVEDDTIIGVGTGSTVNFFIAELIKTRARIKAAVSSSEASTQLLRAGGIEVLELNNAGSLSIYVDGAPAEATNSSEAVIANAANRSLVERIILEDLL